MTDGRRTFIAGSLLVLHSLAATSFALPATRTSGGDAEVKEKGTS